jgi:hypothetical protein
MIPMANAYKEMVQEIGLLNSNIQDQEALALILK